jgi:hypothetical protein
MGNTWTMVSATNFSFQSSASLFNNFFGIKAPLASRRRDVVEPGTTGYCGAVFNAVSHMTDLRGTA